MPVYKFRNCLLNTSERAVIKERQHLELTSKTFDVLQFLIERAGTVVSKDELLGHVWSGNFVEESNLPVHISKLRRSLSERLDCRYIETVQGTGYRFVAPIHTVGEDEWDQARPNHDGAKSGCASSGLHSIAVLPLRNEAANTEIDYLTDGLTEALMNGLSQIPRLRVIARNTVFRFRNSEVDAVQLGEALGASAVITGRIRTYNGEIVVGVELVSTSDGVQMWGGQYRGAFSQILTLQEEITFSIIERLQPTNGRKYFSQAGTRNAESYRLFLKGKYFLERRSSPDFELAIDYFKQSLAHDPENIYSYAELIESYRLLYVFDFISYDEFCRSILPYRKILNQQGRNTAELQIMYCDLKMLEWKFDEATQHCRQALAFNPNCLKGRLRYSDLLLQSGNFAGTLEQLEIIMTLDPLSALTYVRTARLFYLTGRYDDAIAYIDDALELESGSYEALALRGAVQLEMHNYAEALTDFENSLKQYPHPEILAMVAVVHSRQGRAEKATRILKQLEAESKTSSGHFTRLAHVYLALGRKDEAYDSLDIALTMHEPDLRALNYDRRWLPLRGENRFRKLIDRVGLPVVPPE